MSSRPVAAPLFERLSGAVKPAPKPTLTIAANHGLFGNGPEAAVSLGDRYPSRVFDSATRRFFSKLPFVLCAQAYELQIPRRIIIEN